MNLAKLSANGQITVPAEVRRRLHLVPGDKVLFVEKPNGEVVVAKAGLSALAKAQAAFAGAASDFGVTDEDDVQALVDDAGARFLNRVLVDTNVVISALLFPNSTPAQALALVLQEHRLVLTQWVIDELREVVNRKRAPICSLRSRSCSKASTSSSRNRVIRAFRSPTLTTSPSSTRPLRPLST